jgi:ribosome-binding protein aMBF1 (putative translation factor)
VFLAIPLKAEHKPRWNPKLEEWYCCICGRTSDHKAEADARAELLTFDCSLFGTQKKDMTSKDRKKTAIMQNIQKKF